MQTRLLSLAVIAAFAFTAAAVTCGITLDGQPSVLAKHGKDDPAGDDRGNDGPGHTMEVAKHGKDDPVGDDRGNDGPGHTRELA